MEKPFIISVVTATRNRVDLLPRCIESIASQTYPHKEHVIVDGASTDGTAQLLKRYAEKYPHIKYLSEPDSGLSEALNKGIALATGDCIGVLGDDDYYEPGAFETIAAEFARRPEVGLVVGTCNLVLNDGSVFRVDKGAYTSRIDLVACWKHWGRDVRIPAPSTFIAKKAIAEAGVFNEDDRYAMDYDHWIRITRNFGISIVDKHIANFRFDGNTISHQTGDKQWAETIRISKRYWGEFGILRRLGFIVSYNETVKLRPMLGRIRRAARRLVPARGK